MKLANPFPEKVRLLYLGCWTCWKCGSNGSMSGGLEIHHILGRVSDSAFNSSCLCKECHGKVGHTRAEHGELFRRTFQYLRFVKFKPEDEDMEFLRDNFEELELSTPGPWTPCD